MLFFFSIQRVSFKNPYPSRKIFHLKSNRPDLLQFKENAFEVRCLPNRTYTYLLLAECSVRTASYGPRFLLPFMTQARSAQAMKTRKEKTRTARTEQTRLVRCLLYGFVDYSEKVIEIYRSVRLLTDLELTNHSTRIIKYNGII